MSNANLLTSLKNPHRTKQKSLLQNVQNMIDHKRRGANGISVASGCSHSGQAGEGSASRLPLSALQCRKKSSASKRQRESG